MKRFIITEAEKLTLKLSLDAAQRLFWESQTERETREATVILRAISYALENARVKKERRK